MADCTQSFAFGKALVPVHGYNERCHITKVNESKVDVAISVDLIDNGCIYVKFSDEGHGYVCEFPDKLDSVIC